MSVSCTLPHHNQAVVPRTPMHTLVLTCDRLRRQHTSVDPTPGRHPRGFIQGDGPLYRVGTEVLHRTAPLLRRETLTSEPSTTVSGTGVRTHHQRDTRSFIPPHFPCPDSSSSSPSCSSS